MGKAANVNAALRHQLSFDTNRYFERLSFSTETKRKSQKNIGIQLALKSRRVWA